MSLLLLNARLAAQFWTLCWISFTEYKRPYILSMKCRPWLCYFKDACYIKHNQKNCLGLASIMGFFRNNKTKIWKFRSQIRWGKLQRLKCGLRGRRLHAGSRERVGGIWGARKRRRSHSVIVNFKNCSVNRDCSTLRETWTGKVLDYLQVH